MARRVSALGGTSNRVRHTPLTPMHTTTKPLRHVSSQRALTLITSVAVVVVTLIVISSLFILPTFAPLVVPPRSTRGNARGAISSSGTSSSMINERQANHGTSTFHARLVSSARQHLASLIPVFLFSTSRSVRDATYDNDPLHRLQHEDERQRKKRQQEFHSESAVLNSLFSYRHRSSSHQSDWRVQQQPNDSGDNGKKAEQLRQQQERYYRQFHHDVVIKDRMGIKDTDDEADHIVLPQIPLGDPESHIVTQRPVYAPHAAAPPPVVRASQLVGDDSTAMHDVRSVLARVNGTLLGNPIARKPFVLYRAIGNDLPPRHARGQAYDNVRFILHHESRFHDLDVRWYVNRLIDATQLLRIVELLVAHNQTFMLDPFNFDAYAHIDFDDPDTPRNDRHIATRSFSEMPSMLSSSDTRGGQNNNIDLTIDMLRSSLFSNAASANSTRRRAFRDRLLNSKNQFIIHNNQARNAMLSLGIAAGAEYILPWDGNCFLTSTAWANISSGIASVNRGATQAQVDPDARPVSTLYFTVPMARVINNHVLLHTNYMPPDVSEEPQLIFHRHAKERFDERLAYGCRPKVDLLWRLRIPGWWTALSSHNNPCVVPSADALSRDVPGFDSVRAVGWTARLFSGVFQLEISGGIKKRGASRTDGVEQIAACASRVALQRVYHFSPDTLLLYDGTALERNVALFQTGASVHLREVVAALLKAADNRVHVSMTKPKSQRSRAAYARDAALLALAARFSKSLVHTRAAVVALRAALQSASASISTATSRAMTTEKTETMMMTTTRLTVAPAEAPEAEIFDALEGAQLCILLDAARLLQLSNALSKADMAAVSAWVTARSRWLMNSDSVRDAYFDGGLDGTLAEITAACLHAFSNDTRRLLRRTALARLRLRAQYAPEGPGWADGIAGVAAWVAHASMSERLGVDVWRFRVGSTFPLRHALAITVADAMDTRFAAPVHSEWDTRVARILIAIANARYRNTAGGAWTDLSSHPTAKLRERRSKPAEWNESLHWLDAPVSDQDDEILPPFWNLAFAP